MCIHRGSPREDTPSKCYPKAIERDLTRNEPSWYPDLDLSLQDTENIHVYYLCHEAVVLCCESLRRLRKLSHEHLLLHPFNIFEVSKFGVFSKDLKASYHSDTCTLLFTAPQFVIAKSWK